MALNDFYANQPSGMIEIGKLVKIFHIVLAVIIGISSKCIKLFFHESTF